jgi:hypothetical protein
MKQYLLFLVLACGSAAACAQATQLAQQVVDATAASASKAMSAPAGRRHLSAEERAELRRQLRQFNSLRLKGR